MLENGIIVWRKKGEKTREKEERKIERKREKERRRNKKEREARKKRRKEEREGKKHIYRESFCVCVCKNSAVTESEPQEHAGFDSKQTCLLAYSFLVFLSP